jgi:phospholipid transport system substrate-binding protein
MTNRSFTIIAMAVAATAFVSATAIPAAPGTPEEVIRSTSAKVIEVLADNTKTTAQKKTILDSYLDTCCDFVTISKLVMAKNWKSLKESQQDEFIGLFRKYLVATYGDAIENYSGETVEILSGRKEVRDDYTVMTKIARGGGQADLLVDYRLRQVNGEWRIIDVIAEGISMVSNLRSQFQEVITRDGTDGLLAQLREKTKSTASTGGAALAQTGSGA